MVLRDVQLKLVETATNFSDDVLTLEFEVDSIDADQVQAALNPNDWNRDVHFLYHLFEHLVQLRAFSWHELDRRFIKQLIAPLGDLSLRYAAVFHVTDGEMLVSSVKFDLLLNEAMHLCFFFLHDRFELCLQCSPLIFFLAYDA